MPEIRGVRKIYSQFYHPIQGSLRVLVDPVASSLAENPQLWLGEGGISWMGHKHTQKREEFTQPVEYSHAWLSASIG